MKDLLKKDFLQTTDGVEIGNLEGIRYLKIPKEKPGFSPKKMVEATLRSVVNRETAYLLDSLYPEEDISMLDAFFVKYAPIKKADNLYFFNMEFYDLLIKGLKNLNLNLLNKLLNSEDGVLPKIIKEELEVDLTFMFSSIYNSDLSYEDLEDVDLDALRKNFVRQINYFLFNFGNIKKHLSIKK